AGLPSGVRNQPCSQELVDVGLLRTLCISEMIVARMGPVRHQRFIQIELAAAVERCEQDHAVVGANAPVRFVWHGTEACCQRSSERDCGGCCTDPAVCDESQQAGEPDVVYAMREGLIDQFVRCTELPIAAVQKVAYRMFG